MGGKPKCHPHPSPMDLPGAVSTSCNSYFCYVFRSIIDNRKKYPNVVVGYNAWRDYVLSFGVGVKIHTDLPQELPGNVPTQKYYDKYNTNIIKSLIAANADVNKADMDSRTPLYYAREESRERLYWKYPQRMIKMLVDAGAKDENENELIPPASNKPIKIPEDKQENAISYEDILDGDDVVVITEKDGHEFFFKFKTLNEWFNRLKQRKVDIENPLTKVKVKKGDVTRGIANIKSSKGGTRRFRKNARKITRKR
jgi:hypothetical protein